MKFLILFSALAASLSAFASNLPKDFDRAQWQALIAKAELSHLTSTASDGHEYHSLAHLNPADTKVSHRADYFSAVGYQETEGPFHTERIEIVSEAWQVSAAGIRSVDQWGWRTETNGDLNFVMHKQFSEDKDGTVIVDKSFPVRIDDPEILKALGAKLKEWQGF